MPTFTLITDLSQKADITGDEVIQITASEKTTLSKLFEALGPTVQDSILKSSQVPETNIADNAITSLDTVLSAIYKIFARTGGENIAIYPFHDSDDFLVRFGIICYDIDSVSGGISMVYAIYTTAGSHGHTDDSAKNLYYRCYQSVGSKPSIPSENMTPLGLWDWLVSNSEQQVITVTNKPQIEDYREVRLEPGCNVNALPAGEVSRLTIEDGPWDAENQATVLMPNSIRSTDCYPSRNLKFSSDFDTISGTQFLVVVRAFKNHNTSSSSGKYIFVLTKKAV